MKFKKVEVDAFRAYKSKADGTFDFTFLYESSKEIAANLVVIYGPNGFGKTSFFDAVEWGMTNLIKRLENSEELAKDERKHSADHFGRKSKQYILKNRDAIDKEHGEVILTFDMGKSKPRKTEEIRKGQNDYFPLKELENAYFQDVVLSQELIDAFLREIEPEDRYRRFVEYYDTCKNADQLYENIKQLRLECGNEIRENRSDIVDKQKEIGSKEIPEGIVEQTNGIINNLINQSCIDLSKLTPINKDFSFKEINTLRSNINKYMNDIMADEIGPIARYKNIETEVDNLVSKLPTYLRAKVEKNQAEADMKRLGDLKSRFDELETLKNERKKREEERETIRKELNSLLRFEDLRPKHDLIMHDIDSRTEDIESL